MRRVWKASPRLDRKPFPQVNLQEHQDKILVMLALLISAVVGLSIVGFVAMTEKLGTILLTASPVSRVLSPLVGSLVGGWLLFQFFPEARGSGIPQTRVALILNKGFISLRTVLGKFICSSISLGSGVALGREGPSVHIGAGLSSVIGRGLGLSDKHVRSLLPVGTAAAVAAAFNTPLAAVLFTLEEILADLHARLVGTVVIGAATSWVILRLLLGDEPLFHVPAYDLVHPIEFAVYAALGVIGGVVSTIFVKFLLWQRAKFLLVPLRWRPFAPAVGGLTVGLLALLHPGVLGVGYNLVSDSLNGHLAVTTMVALLAMKLVATATCYGSGNAGGVFGPSLFLGAMLGGAVGTVAHMWLPDQTGSVGAYALVGMGVAFAGIVRTPMTSVVMIFEVTRDYTIIVPLMLANLVSYLIAKKLQHVPLYEALAHQEGISMPSPEHLPEPLTVEQASLSAFGDDEPSVPSVYVDDPLEAALQRMGAAGTKQIAVFRRTQAVPFASLRFDDAIEAYRTSGTAKAEEAPAQDWLRTGIVVASAVVLLIAGLTVWQRSRQTEFTQETFARGQDLVAKGQFDDAVSAFRSALARNSDDAKVRRALAIALVDSGHFAEAQSYLDEVLKQQSQDGPLRSAAAKAAQATGDKNQALALYRRSLAANWTSDEEPRRQQTLLEFVTLLVESGQRREAASRILAALNDDSIGPSFGRELANLLKLSGSPEQVETAYSTLTTRFPSDVESWIGLGDTRFDANKDSLALEAYRKAATLRPGDADTSVRVALVEEIRQLDPTLPNTSARVRAQRWDSILQRLLDAGEACAPPNLREKAKVAQKTSSSLAALDQKAKAAEELWDTVSECKADPVLAHIFGRLSRL